MDLELKIEQIEGMVFPEEKNDQDLFVESSCRIVDFLKTKASSHNAIYPNSRTNIHHLKKIFCNAPIEGSQDVVAQAIAYVNIYLKNKRSNTFTKEIYNTSLRFDIEENQITAARKEIQEAGLSDIDINSLEDLYIEDYEKIRHINWFDV